jgi:hypothetical protein
MKTTPAPAPSLEEAPSKNIFQTGVMEGGNSGEMVSCFSEFKRRFESIGEVVAH